MKKISAKKKEYNIGYCGECGHRRVIKSHGIQGGEFVSAFNPTTGKPYFEIEVGCPNDKWYKFGLGCFMTNRFFRNLNEKEYRDILSQYGENQSNSR